MKRKKKKDSLRIHSLRRAMERFPDHAPGDLRQATLSAIKNDQSFRVFKSTNRVFVYDIWLIDIDLLIRVIYDKFRKEIITYIPFETNFVEINVEG